jgi:hypothetical protein
VAEDLLEDLSLGIDLARIFQVLPLTPSASLEMRAQRRTAAGSRLQEPRGRRPDEVLLVYDRLYQETIARS